MVYILQATYSRESHLMHLILCFASHFNFWFTASHIAGDTTLADPLSGNNVDLFLSQVPQAHQLSSRIPPPLIDLLVCNITWTSTAWTKLFRDILQLLYPQLLTKHIKWPSVDMLLSMKALESPFFQYRKVFCATM